MATDKQVKYIQQLRDWKQVPYTDADIKEVKEMSDEEASALIDELKAIPAPAKQGAKKERVLEVLPEKAKVDKDLFRLACKIVVENLSEHGINKGRKQTIKSIHQVYDLLKEAEESYGSSPSPFRVEVGSIVPINYGITEVDFIEDTLYDEYHERQLEIAEMT